MCVYMCVCVCMCLSACVYVCSNRVLNAIAIKFKLLVVYFHYFKCLHHIIKAETYGITDTVI